MGNGREYGLISKRSKQILGQDVLPKTAGGSACTMQGSSTSAGVGQDKRRGQVLQAQRTHRQRTQMYIKILEKEVLRLRESEREAIERAQALQKQVNGLLHALAQNSASSPAASDERSNFQDAASYGHVTSNIEGDRGVYVHVEFSESPSTVSPVNDRGTAEGEHRPWKASFNLPEAPPASSSVLEKAPSTDDSDSLLADPRVGIQFVLALETDCMDHLRGKHLDHGHSGIINSESEFSGHVSTACFSLWQQNTSNLSTTATYDISNNELDRLLSSSLNLGLAPPEITPVQIWNRVRRLGLSGGKDALENLTRDLREHVVCLGFGAVLDEGAVEDILKCYFPYLPPNTSSNHS
ncbi:hypothetical protein GGS23DRAFT_579844 [Durotheca rogersii]|uniref:uncharacterized protein n=1 Tax=Durotheca rogersii TaxID=419775 RepID=UPI00221E4B27|nr:uncharacterized protein GGS23DRAFT_579844 [Durotheca rogersii]KAI5860684.1 hypothetical protein GGS23DRAFT_579844 [Durotheca rogersii]